MLFLGLALVFAWPAAGQVDAEEEDSAMIKSSGQREAPAREVRPALAKRKRNALSQFDPKIFEERGRGLQDQYYEIASPAKADAGWSAAPALDDAAAEGGPAAPARGISASKTPSKNWMIWSGAAGLAAIVGGAAGYLLLEKHTAPDPVSVQLDDNPDNP